MSSGYRSIPNAADTFIAIAAHELREPLAAAQMYLGVTRRKVRAPDAAWGVQEVAALDTALGLVTDELERVNRLLTLMMDVARRTHRPDEASLSATDLAPLLGKIADLPRVQLTMKGPLWVACDAVQIERVLENLLSNALKYGAGKPVRIRARSSRDGVVIRVHDGGIGLGTAEHERIFDAFRRGGGVRAYPGLGVGLWLGRTIIQAHGGQLRVASSGKRGTTFELRLPALERAARA